MNQFFFDFVKLIIFFKWAIKSCYISIDAEIYEQINEKNKKSKKSIYLKLDQKQKKKNEQANKNQCFICRNFFL